VAETLQGLQPERADGVRPIAPADLHMTLHFLGQAEVRAVDAAIAQVETRPFAVRVDRTGAFSLRGGRRILWLGVDLVDGLTELYEKTGEALGRIGFEPESRPWVPHITLARLAAGAPRSLVDRFTASQLPRGPVEFACREFALYASETDPEGARYRVLERYPIGSAGSLPRHRAG
jgi:2'-5' RNA ligase